MRKDNYLPLGIIVILILAVVAMRLPLLGTLELDINEVWGIWQAFGSPADTLRWTPFDWGPLSYQLLYVWKTLVGIHPLPLRILSLFTFLVSIAIVYRLARRLLSTGPNSLIPLLATGAYCALGSSVYFSMLLRGYVFVLTLMPLSIWLAIRYFHKPDPKRALVLAIVMAVEFYIHPTVVSGFVVLGIYTAIFHLRRFWLWWMPGLLAFLFALPEIYSKYKTAVAFTRAWSSAAVSNEALSKLYSSYAGNVLPVWLILLTVATLFLVVGLARRKLSIRVVAFILLWVLLPAILYIANPVFGTYVFFSLEHLPWVGIGLALWVAIGLNQAPRQVSALAIAALAVSLIAASPNGLLQILTPYMKVFPYLARSMRAGDVVIFDPSFSLDFPEAWKYYTKVYFPNGLGVVTSPENHRRIWYAKKDGFQDANLQQAVLAQRREGVFFGPWDFLFRLYEAPPDPEGILFENGMRFHGAEILDEQTSDFAVYHDGETIHLRLWWSVDKQIPLDYSASVKFILPDGKLGSQNDGPPAPDGGPSSTSQWIPGRFYVEDRSLTLPYPLATQRVPLADRYSLYLGIYYYADGKLIPAPKTNADHLLPIQTIWLKSWR